MTARSLYGAIKMWAHLHLARTIQNPKPARTPNFSTLLGSRECALTNEMECSTHMRLSLKIGLTLESLPDYPGRSAVCDHMRLDVSYHRRSCADHCMRPNILAVHNCRAYGQCRILPNGDVATGGCSGRHAREITQYAVVIEARLRRDEAMFTDRTRTVHDCARHDH